MNDKTLTITLTQNEAQDVAYAVGRYAFQFWTDATKLKNSGHAISAVHYFRLAEQISTETGRYVKYADQCQELYESLKAKTTETN